MTGGWKIKRFWTDVTVEAAEGGFTVALDGKPLRTPGKAVVIVPTRALALCVANEWRMQTEELQPGTMHATRTVNSAIDRVSAHRAKVVADLAAYGESDLICYRAEGPVALRKRQDEAWDPLLGWAELRYGARLRTGEGVMPVVQPAQAVERLAAEVARQDVFRLTAFHDLVALSGSLVISLAVIEDVRSPGQAWTLSRIDEDWQAEEWGEDREAALAAAGKRAAFLEAARLHAVCRG
jgi:chaperone required for assembly of F1-ATPase